MSLTIRQINLAILLPRYTDCEGVTHFESQGLQDTMTLCGLFCEDKGKRGIERPNTLADCACCLSIVKAILKAANR